MFLPVCLFSPDSHRIIYLSFYLNLFTLLHLYPSLSVDLLISVYSPCYISIFHCLPICLSQSIYLAVSPSIYHSIYFCVYPSIKPPIIPSVYLSTYLSINLSVCSPLSVLSSITPPLSASPSASLIHIYTSSNISRQAREERPLHWMFTFPARGVVLRLSATDTSNSASAEEVLVWSVSTVC